MPFICGYKFRGIQEYIARGGRLKDIAGGSELIDSLCRTRLAGLLGAMGIGALDKNGVPSLNSGHGHVLQADSGRILVEFADKANAEQFTRLWPLVANQWAPHGRHAIALREATDSNIADTVRSIYGQIEGGPELPLMALPLSSPLTRRDPRTGLPVTRVAPYPGNTEYFDASGSRRNMVLGQQDGESLKNRFGFGNDDKISLEMDEIADAGDSDLLAVVHADGTGFGDRFRQVLKRPKGIEAGVELSALTRSLFRDAATVALNPLRDVRTTAGDIACRPILLGGDDMTILVPGRFGWQVARCFLDTLEKASRTELPVFAKKYNLEGPEWQCLYAGAGIAFVHAHYPFDLALRLADTCARWAKDRLKKHEMANRTSCLQFHVALDSATDDFDQIFEQQLVKRDDSGTTKELTAGPYVTTAVFDSRFATLDQLDALVRAVAALPRRGWREVSRLIHESDVSADRRLRRQVDLLNESQRTGVEAALQAFGKANTIWSEGPSKQLRTPVQDVDVLVGLLQRFDQTDGEERGLSNV